MSGYPNQPNQHQLQQQQQMLYQQQQQESMMMGNQQGNQMMQMNYGMGGMGQPNEAYMHQTGQPHYPMNAPASGMNPLVYNTISSNFQPRSPYMGSMGGPHSIPQPGSVNPMSVGQAPGSVPQPGSMQGGPGSVQGPMSVPQQGPGSVGPGPMSVPPAGSMSGPLSVNQPSSVMGPGSIPPSSEVVGMGNTLSVPTPGGGLHPNRGPSPSSIPSHMNQSMDGSGRSPLPPPSTSMPGPSPSGGLPQGTSPSVHNPMSHGGPQSVSFNPSTPYNAPSSVPPQPKPVPPQVEDSQPYDGIFLVDPMNLAKQLIAKDLRNSFSEMNKSMGELLKHRDNLTAEQNDKYTRDYNEFMAVCDQVEQALTVVMETSKMMQKLDKSYAPEGGATARNTEYTIPPLVNYVEDTNTLAGNVEKTVGGVFEMMKKIRKRENLYKEKNEMKMETD